MATTAAALPTASAPSLDALRRERMDLENALRLWALGVRFAVRDLVALGRPLELQLTPHSPASADPSPLADLRSLGFDLAPLYGSHVMRVIDSVGAPALPRMASRVIGLQGKPTGPDVSPLNSVRPDDFLVGIRGDDVLLAPVSGLAQVRKRILGACNEAIARGAGVVTLRFVRLDTLVQVDPTRRVTHDSVLLALEKLYTHFEDLKASYDRLLTRNRAAVTQRLTRHKLLLGFGMHHVQAMRAAVEQDERFRFAARFQEWYTAMMAETEYAYDDEEEDQAVDVVTVDSDADMESTVYEIDGDSGGGDEGEEVATVPPISVNPSRPPAEPRPTTIDVQWRDVLHRQEMKWLPNADTVLTKFIEALVDGFASDGLWVPEIVSCSRGIVERLVKMHARKLTVPSMDNTTVRKEFMQHARMLRNNIASPRNQQLRRDVLSGGISIDVLSDMSSEQLAPRALQEDRQRRYEQHAKEITITAPSGLVLKKTKHGFQEVLIPGTSTADGVVMETSTPVESSSDHAVADSMPQPPGGVAAASVSAASASSEGAAEDVTQRLKVLGVDSSTENDTTSCDDKKNDPPSQQIATTSMSSREIQNQPKAMIDAPTLDTVTFSAEDFRRFLMVMFDPAQDLEGTIAQLQSTIHSTPLATMSNEFMLAQGVQLFRDIQTAHSQHGTVRFRARVRLLNWTFPHDASNDQEATIFALNQLLRELHECRRLFGSLLDRVCQECGLPQAAFNHQAQRLVVDVLVRQGMRVRDQVSRTRDHDNMADQWRADAWIANMIITTAYANSVIDARHHAARGAGAFVTELVKIRSSTVGPPVDPYPAVQNVRNQPVQPNGDYHHGYHPDTRHVDNGLQIEELHAGTNHTPVDRKRPFEHMSGQADVSQPPHSRQKVEPPPRQPEPTPRDAPVFFTDSKGEELRPPADPAEKERKEKLTVETYQELVRALFRSRDDVKARARFDWNPDIPEQVVEFGSRLKVIRTVGRSPVSGDFVCSVQGLDGNLFITNTNSSLEAAAKYVTGMLHQWLDGVYRDWRDLLTAYNKILERKLLQRGQQADARLSAANETRKDRTVAKFTKEQERTRGSLHEYTIFVRNMLAIRQVCLNMKMAKRAAGEEFRDLLDWMNRARQDNMRGRTTPSPATGSSTASRTGAAPAPPARAPSKSRAKNSNMVACSDDSDDDDDDDYYDGGGYSDDDDWHPQSKSSDSAIASTAGIENGAANVRSRIEETLKRAYPIESESDNSDDSKFRAVIRSLFTPADDLCAGISRIRGALKYRGRSDSPIVQNVKASIWLELVRGETFNVYASVNDVIHWKASARSKAEACDLAVNGLLKELDKTLQVWTEMVHFYHTKELSNNDPMDSFNALRLANIAKIETRIELPPSNHPHNRAVETKMASDVHCAIYFGENVVYRVNEAIESDAHTMATCRALRFVIDLIDRGLDPTPLGAQDQRFAPMPDADLRCSVRLADFGDRERFVDFEADARWVIPGRVPGRDLVLPKRVRLNQIGRVSMPNFEREFGSSNDPGLYYFRLEATYENGRFVNHIAEYGHKNKYRAYVLHLEVLENTDVDVYLFPPGASVNSTSNLYWSHKVMPGEIDDFKSVYGYVVNRRPSLLRH